MAFTVMSKCSRLGYAVANASKRVASIAFAVWWFGKVVSALNAAGTALALAGVLLYNLVKHVERRARETLPLTVNGDAGKLAKNPLLWSSNGHALPQTSVHLLPPNDGNPRMMNGRYRPHRS